MGEQIMVNIAIIDDNLNYSRNLMKFLSESNPNLRFVSIVANGKEALKSFNNGDMENIDIILLDMKLPYYNGNEILKFLEFEKNDKFKNSIIAISGESSFLASMQNNKYIYTYINKIEGFDKILIETNNLIKIKQSDSNSLKMQVLKELNYLNFNDNFVGTKYLLESILIILQRYKFNDYNLKKDVYPIIASKYNKTINNIKCNINNATIMMNCECEKSVLMKYFNFYDDRSEAKPKQVIETVINKIKRCSIEHLSSQE